MKRIVQTAAKSLIAGSFALVGSVPSGSYADARLSQFLDESAGNNWPAYGRTYGEQHFSPLKEINQRNVAALGLAWAFDLPPGNSMSGPIAVDGVLYTATGYSVVRAFNAANGNLLWKFDPKAADRAGHKLRQGWGIRGLAWWNGKILVGTHDGRLIAVDARNGTEIWSQMTVDRDDNRFITGAPRIFDGKVIIGHGGADSGDTRGYVTTYDADTGKLLWRFYTVPGDPAKGFEDETQAMAAKTWAGAWWRYGGGGTAWNSFTFDPESDTVFIGTGNGAPWNYRIRSQGKGDNLFLCSVVALDAKTGLYKWHYQFNPAETWDFNAAMDMQLGTLSVDGRPRQVLMEMPKNGFFYVLDRNTGKLLSADKIGKVTWAQSIDLQTGRPVENPHARFPEGESFTLFPGMGGAHTWLPSAYNQQSGLMYMPVSEVGLGMNDRGVPSNWKRLPGNLLDAGLNFDLNIQTREGVAAASYLVAWDAQARHEVWRVETPGGWNGGVLATAGQLVFQGNAIGKFSAYDGATGKLAWQFDAQAPVLAPPITYFANGRQYVTVLSGISTSAGAIARNLPKIFDYRTQPRRVLTFALGGTAQLPQVMQQSIVAVKDPGYKADDAAAARGAFVYATHCIHCHGPNVIAAGSAPDLRSSSAITDAAAFELIVRKGILVPNGMPRWEDMNDGEVADVRQYLRSQATDYRVHK
jgi:quinohemoprotein ethanol dehydrogenase